MRAFAARPKTAQDGPARYTLAGHEARARSDSARQPLRPQRARYSGTRITHDRPTVDRLRSSRGNGGGPRPGCAQPRSSALYARRRRPTQSFRHLANTLPRPPGARSIVPAGSGGAPSRPRPLAGCIRRPVRTPTGRHRLDARTRSPAAASHRPQGGGRSDGDRRPPCLRSKRTPAPNSQAPGWTRIG